MRRETRDVVISVIVGVALFGLGLLVFMWGTWQAQRRSAVALIEDARVRLAASGDAATEALTQAALDALRAHRVRSLWPHEAAELAAQLVATSGVGALWVDVRSRAEYEVSHLPGAILWEDGRGDPPPDVATSAAAGDRPIIVYCSVGRRSGAAVESLRRVRSTVSAHNLLGGIFLWAEQGRALEGGATVHPYDPTWGRLLRADLHHDPATAATADSTAAAAAAAPPPSE